MSIRRKRYCPLTESDIKKIDQASMEILSTTGFEVRQPEAFEYFKSVAADVNEENKVVKISEQTVRELIGKAPSEVTLYGRDNKHDCRLGSGEVYFGTGGTALNMLDFGQAESRPALLKDLENVTRVVDNMENIDICLLPTYPNDIDVSEVDINRFRTGLKYTGKHIMGGVYTADGIDATISLAEDIAGSAEKLREKPFISFIACGISPLRLDNEYGTFMIKVAREGLPLAVPVEPLCGATSPMSLAGTLVIQNCDSLINIMLTQLVNPGTPVIYGCVSSTMEMKTMRYLGAPVESGLVNAATAQMTHFYGIPYYATAGISDSKKLDSQGGYEAAITNLLVGLAEADFIHDSAGLMEFALTVSLEKLVIDNDIIGMVKRAIRGIDVNDETLSLDDIKKTGPGGNFVTSRSSRKYLRTEHYQPTISDRLQRSVWLSEGQLSAEERANEVVESILREPAHIYS